MVASSKVCKKSLLCYRLVREEDYCHLVCCREDIWQWVLSCIDSYSPGKHEYFVLMYFKMFWVQKQTLLQHECSSSTKPNCYQTAMIKAHPQIWHISIEKWDSTQRLCFFLSTYMSSLIYWEVSFVWIV